jgi:hypothetical protein
VRLLNQRIADKKAERDLQEIKEADEEIAQESASNEAMQPVLVRIVEWTEWIPATLVELGERADPRDPTGKNTVMQKMPMHRGYTGFVGGSNEHMVDIAVEATGHQRLIELDENGEDGKPLKVMYGLYAFQAVLARNVPQEFLDGVMDGQNKPLTRAEEREIENQGQNGRDRRKDLIIVGGAPTPGAPPPPSRNNKKRPKR